jgi:hypothetical protein
MSHVKCHPSHGTCNVCDSARRACNSDNVAESALVELSASFAISRTLSDKILQLPGAEDVSYGSTWSQMKATKHKRSLLSTLHFITSEAAQLT